MSAFFVFSVLDNKIAAKYIESFSQLCNKTFTLKNSRIAKLTLKGT